MGAVRDTCLWTGRRHALAVGMKLKKTNGALLPGYISYVQMLCFWWLFSFSTGPVSWEDSKRWARSDWSQATELEDSAEETRHWVQVQIHVLESLAWLACGKGHNTFFFPFFHIVIDLYPKATLKQTELTRSPLNLRSKNKRQIFTFYLQIFTSV